MNFKVQNFITQDQINQLIYYSNNDTEVLKFTHDSKRFRNINSFNKWFNNHIEIYVLTNNTNNLLGIIWIKLKENDLSKFKHTFAIRIYKPLRGRGYSYKFAKEVYDELVSKIAELKY